MKYEAILIPALDSPGEITELLVEPGQQITSGEPLLVIESDKASMELPSSTSGKLVEWLVRAGDSADEGITVAHIEAENETGKESAPPSVAKPVDEECPEVRSIETFEFKGDQEGKSYYAGPAVRRLARELGVSLADVSASGARNRIVKEDLKRHVKARMSQPADVQGSAIPEIPQIDHSRFGPVTAEKLNRVDRLTAEHMQRCWLNVPQVTIHDDVNIEELETYRKQLAKDASLNRAPSLLAFIVKVCGFQLSRHRRFNSSLGSNGNELIYKNYVNIGVAVDTTDGLMVPVIKAVDRKSIPEIAQEIEQLAEKARSRSLKPQEMQGGCFTVSSLGKIGGRGFTPIVNAPEVGILGVGCGRVLPEWDGEAFQPVMTVPLSLSFDHRVINGVAAGAFLADISASLSDIRKLLF